MVWGEKVYGVRDPCTGYHKQTCNGIETENDRVRGFYGKRRNERL